MDRRFVKTLEGVQIMKDGLSWGVIYQDGHATEYGWGDPIDMEIHNPEFCTKPSDVTYEGSPDVKELNTGKLVSVKRITTLEIQDGQATYSIQ